MQNTFRLFCLIAPVLALVQLVMRFALEQGTAGARLRAVFTRECWLLWDGWSDQREKLATPVFCCVALLWWGTGPIGLLLEWYAPPGLPTAFATLRSLALAGLILGKIFCLTRWSGRQLLLGGLAVGLWAYAGHVSGYGQLTAALLLAVAVKDTRLPAVLKSMLAAQAFDFAFTVSTALLGLQGNMITVFDTGRTRVRMALGYGSYNSCGFAAAGIALLWLCVRWRRLRWWDVAAVLGVIAFIDLVPNSRSAELLCLITLAAGLLFRAWPKLLQNRLVRAGCAAAAPLLCAVSYTLACLYDPANPIMARLDSLLSGRIQLAWNTMFFNPAVEWYWFGQPFITWNFYLVDNTYIYYLYLCGPFFTALLVLGGSLLCLRLAKSGGQDSILLACALGFLAYAVVERVVSPNLLVLLAANALFGGSARPLTLNGPDDDPPGRTGGLPADRRAARRKGAPG